MALDNDLNDPYASFDEYALVTPTSSTSQHKATVERQLVSVSRYLDRELFGDPRHTFNQVAAAEARVFKPRHTGPINAEAENPYGSSKASRYLAVDPIATEAGLVILIDKDRDGSFADEAALAATDYELLPRNADKGPEPAPWTEIFLTEYGNEVGWPLGARVEVTAVWGWPAVPSAIKDATIELTRLLRVEGPRATTQITDVGGVGATLATSRGAQRIVSDLKRHYAEVSF